MAQEIIDFGSYPNDPDSDAIRVAFQKTQNNFNELFSIQYQTGVSQVVEGAGISLDQNTGNVTITNRIANITIQTDANFKIGVTTATSNTATINSGTTPFVINLANAITTGNITATGGIQGVLSANSNSQPNITTVGNLGNLSVVGTIRSNAIVSNNVNALNFTATYMTSPGSNNQILLNSLGNIDATSNLTFNGNLLTVTGAISATGNITAQNFINSGNAIVTGNITANANITCNLNMSATGNITAGNFVGRFANGTSNIRIPNANGNILLSVAGVSNVLQISSTEVDINGLLEVLGNANIGNLTATSITTIGNANVGNIFASININAVGNISGGNLLTSGSLSVAGNLTANNFIAGGIISAVGNLSASNMSTTGNVNATGTIFSNSSLATNGVISANGTVTAGNVSTVTVSATGNVQALNLRTTGVISAQGNLTANTANLGNSVNANFFIGSGNNLSNIQGANVTGNVISANVSFFANVNATTNANITTYLPFVNTTSGNANLVTDSTLSYNANSKVLSANALSIIGNIVAGNINVQTGTLTGRNLSTGANTTQGNITGNWTLTAGSRLIATYADLAENYAGDQFLDPGTVVEFGGENEVTLCLTPNSTKVAGVVSTNPAYVMNGMIKCIYPVSIALQGRVPTNVTGKISKGDLMVSAGNGLATACSSPIIGSVIGKSLEDFEGSLGTIEIAIGRL